MPATPAKTGSTSPDRKTPFIDYHVGFLPGQFTEVYNQTSTATTLLATVDWSDSSEFLFHMLGYSEVIGGELSRVLPEVNPYNSNQYCISCELVNAWGRGLDDDNTDNSPDTPTFPALFNHWPSFEKAVYKCTFAAPLYDVAEDSEVDNESKRFVVYKTAANITNEKIPGGGFILEGTSTPLSEVGTRTASIIQVEAKWLDIPAFDRSRLSSFGGKVNVDSFVLDGTTWPAEVILFETWSEEPKRNAFGNRTYDITFKFSIRTDGRSWNKFWSNGSKNYVYVSTDGIAGSIDVSNTKRPYRYADFDDIFKVS